MKQFGIRASGATILILVLFIALFSGCQEDSPPLPDVTVTGVQVLLNSSGVAPLTAEVIFQTDMEVSVILRVVGQYGPASDIVQTFPEISKQFRLPALGLYAGFENQVELTFQDADNNMRGSETVSIITGALLSDLPEIDVGVALDGMKPGLTLVNYFGYDHDPFPQHAFMFDQFGDIRWYLDYSDHPTLGNLFYDNGMIRLANGNLFFGDGSTDALYEISMLGEIKNIWSLHGYGFHHHVHEKPNGNFLVTVNDHSIPTVEDLILEIDRNTKTIVNQWDLTESLDKSRRAWPTDLANIDFDWFHANGIAYDPVSDAVIVSGRTQGVVKLNNNNEVIWILAPHRDWFTAGNDVELSQFLLQPLDAQGNSIENAEVLAGEIKHPEFEWSWYQHSPILLPNGNVMVFDNGENRNYTWDGIYSRAVEYEINETNKTIRQAWSYGKERGEETFSRIVSKVEFHPDENTVLFAPGAIDTDGVHGKVVEIDKSSGQVLFEATITPPNAFFVITFHSVERMSLYPE